MKTGLKFPIAQKTGDSVFFFLIFIYQLCFIFQGLDFNDEGFHIAFYQEIFRAPQSVQYNFMYWFSGIIGGIWVYLLPNSGMLGIRIMGVLVQTTTIIITYRLLKKHLDILFLRLGLFIAILILCEDPKDFNYDNLSAFLYIAAAYFLVRGLEQDRLFKLFISGALICLNFFSRLPNILGLSLTLLIIYYAILYRQTVMETTRKIMFLWAGFGITTICVLLFMKSINHYQLFIENIKLVIEMGKSRESSHGVVNMIHSWIAETKLSLKLIACTLVAIVVGAAILNSIKRIINPRYINWVTGIVMILATAFLGMQDKLSNFEMYMRIFCFLRGLVLLTTVLVLLYEPGKHIKILAFLSCLIMVVQPLGSDYLYSSGRYAFWLALPIAFNYWFNLQSFLLKSSVESLPALKATASKVYSVWGINKNQLTTIRNWGVPLLILLLMYYSLTHTWGDSRNRSEMTHSINNKLATGIFTTKKKADALDELLNESAKYIKKDDYVLAYDAIPLYHFLTQTRPFMYNSWPQLYSRDVFKSELYRSLEETKIRPVVVFQKVNTINTTDWPSLADDNSPWGMDEPRNRAIKEFLSDYKYRKVWENTAFSIYVPQ